MDKPDAALRRLTAVCAALSALPLLPQLPPLLTVLVLLLCLAGYLLPKPHRLVLLLVLPVSLAMVLLAYHGRFGRDAAAGMLALMMALKCLETAGLRDLRALLGFALFLPFAALLNDQGPLTLALALLGMLTWLFALQVTSTGTLDWPRGRWRQLASGIGRQMLMAMPLAAALFWLFPRIATPLWGLPGLSDAGAGLGDSMRPGQWLDTLADDRIAFRVSFDGPTPAPEQRYWRGPVLWDFDGLEWRRSRQDSAPTTLLGDDAQAAGGISYSVSLEPTEKRYLPVLDWPAAAPDGYSLSADNSAWSDKPVQRLTQYRARALPSSPDGKVLDAASRQRALAFPRGFNPRTQALARQWRAEAAGERAYIERVLAWIRRDFAYTLDTPEPGINGVDEFLFGYRRGFCQHFSSSFALMMRAAGIPSRVVTGYAGGYRNPYGGYWLLYRRDAHAWNEVWLEGEGWVRIDPTAAVAPENILDTLTTAGGEQPTGGRDALSPLLDVGDFLRTRWNDWMVGFNAARQMQLFRAMGLAEAQRWQMLLVLMTLAALLSYALFLLARRVPQPSDPREKAWQRLLARLYRIGLGKIPHETALDFAQRLGGRAEWSAALGEAARRYTLLRYGEHGPDAHETRALIAELHALTRRIRRGD